MPRALVDDLQALIGKITAKLKDPATPTAEKGELARALLLARSQLLEAWKLL